MPSWSSKLLVAGLVLSVGLTIQATAASARIVPGQSVAGVKLGATTAQLKRRLGAPETRIGTEWRYRESVGLHVRIKRGRVEQILSYLRKQRTPAGITIGSTHAQLARAYPRAVCQAGTGIPYLYCVVAGHVRGRQSYTGFLSESPTGGVVEIELGFGSVAQALKHP